MSRRVVLHVGTMKSGTSYIQSQLFANKDLLLERGVLVPGQAWPSQVQAVRDLIAGRDGMWSKLAGKVADHDGTSVISMEYLGPIRPRTIQRVRETFAVDELTVVVTARDLNRSIAAMWQETMQNGRTWTWSDYLAGIEEWRPGHRAEGVESTKAGRTFWRQQNVVRICRTWAEQVGPERIALVTVPHPGAPRGLLWERFATVLGIEPGGLRPAPAANESIGAASALALRRLNELLDADDLRFPEGAPLRKALLAKQVLAARKGDEPAIGLPVAPWVVDHAAHIRRALEDLGVRLVGEWADLEPVAVPGVDPGTVDPAEVAEAAVAGLAGVLAERIRAERVEGDDPADADPDPDDDPTDDEAER